MQNLAQITADRLADRGIIREKDVPVYRFGTEGDYIPSGAIVAHASYVHSQTREEAVIDWGFDIGGFSFSLRLDTTLADTSYDIW